MDNLPAGSYNLCITATELGDYQKCFTVMVAEPKELSVYTAVNKNSNSVVLNLDGASNYNISLNGISTTTSSSSVTLNLAKGNNRIIVTTDLQCQGVIEKQINLSDDLRPFPNPFTNILNVSLGTEVNALTTISVFDVYNNRVFMQRLSNAAGNVPINLSNLINGVYVLKISNGTTEKIYKIAKNEK